MASSITQYKCEGTTNNTQQYNGKVCQTLQQYSVSPYNVQFGVTCPPTLKEERQPWWFGSFQEICHYTVFTLHTIYALCP